MEIIKKPEKENLQSEKTEEENQTKKTSEESSSKP